MRIIVPQIFTGVNVLSHLVIVVVLLFSNFHSSCFASEVNNAENKTSKAEEPQENKAEINLQIAKKLKYVNYDSSLYYAEKARMYAEVQRDIPLTINALLMIAGTSNSIGKSEESRKLYNKAKNLCISTSNHELLALTYVRLSQYYDSKFNYYKVHEVLDSALVICSEYDITSIMPNALQRFGILYYKLNDIVLADYYAKQTELQLEKLDDIDLLIKNLQLQANIAFKKNEPDIALSLLKKALTIAKKSEVKSYIQVSYRSLAAYYIGNEEYNKSSIYIDSSIVMCNELGLQIEKSALITYKAHLRWLAGDYQGALLLNIEAYNIRKKTGHRAAICSSLLNIGGNYIKLNEYEKAREYINEGLQQAKDQKILSFISLAYNKLSTINKDLGNYEDALNFYELKTIYNDSVMNIRTNEKEIFFNSLLENERTQRLNDSIELQKKNNNIIFLFVVTFLAFGVILLLFRINYVRKNTTKEIIKLSKVIETTDQAVVISDKKGDIIYINNGFLKVLGYNDQTEVLGSIFSFIDESGKNTILEKVVPKVLSENNWRGEIDIVKKDNTSIVAEITCSVVRDKNENPEFFVSIFTDITERKKNEIELKTSRESLKRTIETQDRLFTIIAHDLTSPFTTILGFSKMLADDYFKYNEKDHIRFSKIINESSKQTYDLLNNLLHWSRSQLGQFEIDMEEIDLFAIIDENARLLNQTIINKELNFVNEVEPGYLMNADMATLSIVIRNLLSNAIKFTPRQGNIKITVESSNGENIISVCDSGVGISPDDIVNLFNLTDGNSKLGTEEEKGTGLGLMLCSDLVGLHGGKIKVDSTFGKGTCFHVSLPDGSIKS